MEILQSCETCQRALGTPGKTPSNTPSNEYRTAPKLAIKGKYLGGFRKEFRFAVAVTMREQIRASLFD
jgi:hypothetical protein